MQEDRKNYYAHLVEIIAWLMFDGKKELDRGILLYSDTPHLDEDGWPWRRVQYIPEVLNGEQLVALDTILKENDLHNCTSFIEYFDIILRQINIPDSYIIKGLSIFFEKLFKKTIKNTCPYLEKNC